MLLAALMLGFSTGTARFVINDKKNTNNLARRALFCAFVYGEGATDDSGLTDYTGE